MRIIPHFEQVNDYYCGPAIFSMILGAYGTSITQEEAAVCLDTTEENGTSAEALTQGLRTAGFLITGGNHQTFAEVRKALDEEKIAVVCFVELHLQWDHYAIVKKINETEISLIDPAENTDTYHLSLEEFEKRWVGPLFTHTDHWAIYISKK